MEEISDNLVFGDKAAVRNKLELICREGKDKLHAVFDFDRTLTPGRNENGKDVASWKLLNRRLPADKKAVVDALYKKYRPMELRGEMTVADAIEWWSAVLDAYKGRNLKWSELEVEVEQIVPARSGVKELFDICGRKKIPTVIISAGIKDVIELWCRKFQISPTKILSTTLRFDDNGCVCGWKRESLIHNFNKREMGHSELAGLRRERPYAILAGDNIEDAAMADGIENVLRVFIDEARKDDSRGEHFYEVIFEKFDIVIRGGNLQPLAEIINGIK